MRACCCGVGISPAQSARFWPPSHQLRRNTILCLPPTRAPACRMLTCQASKERSERAHRQSSAGASTRRQESKGEGASDTQCIRRWCSTKTAFFLPLQSCSPVLTGAALRMQRAIATVEHCTHGRTCYAQVRPPGHGTEVKIFVFKKKFHCCLVQGHSIEHICCPHPQSEVIQ